jgi:hypothetical protein
MFVIVTIIDEDTGTFPNSLVHPSYRRQHGVFLVQRCWHVTFGTEIRAVHRVLDVLFVLPPKRANVDGYGRLLCCLPKGASAAGLLYDVMHDIFVNCSWVDTQWQ